MERKMIGFWTAMGVVAAVLVVTVPVIAHIREKQVQERSAEEIRECMENMALETVELQHKLAGWYNLNLTLKKPEPDVLDAYEGILNLGQGRMGLLEFPALELALPITHGIQGPAGHDPATDLPVGGRGNHTVIYLKEDPVLAEGMAVHIRLPGVSLSYRVDSIQVMPEAWPTDCPCPGEMLILVHDRGNERMIIRCVSGAEQRSAVADQWETLKIAGAFAGAMTMLVAVARILDGLRKALQSQRRSAQTEIIE